MADAGKKLNTMTQYKKPIWNVTIKYQGDRIEKEMIQKVASYDLEELLSTYNKEGLKKIIKIEATFVF